MPSQKKEKKSKNKISEAKSKKQRKSHENALVEIDERITGNTEASRVHRDMLGKTVSENKDFSMTGSSKKVADFLNWVEKKYNTNITELPEGTLNKLTKAYIKEQNGGIDIYQTKEQLSKIKKIPGFGSAYFLPMNL